MKYMTINNRKVAFDDEKNVLSVIRKSGINLPTFCYHSELSTYGACRMCVVEDDRGKIFASCSEVPRDGMVIYTNTPRLQHHRKMILELLLSSHCRDCTTCKKNGVCTLQNLAKQLGVSYIRFENNKPVLPLDESSRNLHTAWASALSDLKIQEKSAPSTTAPLLLCAIRINVFSAETVCVPAMRFRDWAFWTLPTGVPKCR